MTSMFFSQQWADGVRDALNAGPTEEALAGKLPEYWDFYNLVRYTYPSSWALGVRGLPDELGGGTGYLVVQWVEGHGHRVPCARRVRARRGDLRAGG